MISYKKNDANRYEYIAALLTLSAIRRATKKIKITKENAPKRNSRKKTDTIVIFGKRKN